MGQQGPFSVKVAIWYLFSIYDFEMDGREKEWKRE
jgi:hypothetical protein